MYDDDMVEYQCIHSTSRGQSSEARSTVIMSKHWNVNNVHDNLLHALNFTFFIYLYALIVSTKLCTVIYTFYTCAAFYYGYPTVESIHS